MAFTPEENFKLLSGQDSVKEYTFNKHVIKHLFCITCGIHSFGQGTRPDGKKMISINARCLDNFYISKAKITPFDGKAL